MPPDGAIIFSDLIGKLDVLRMECPKVRPRGPISARRPDHALWPHRGRDRQLHTQAGAQRHRPVRGDLSGFAEGGLMPNRLVHVRFEALSGLQSNVAPRKSGGMLNSACYCCVHVSLMRCQVPSLLIAARPLLSRVSSSLFCPLRTATVSGS
jgi:hypothetical protein